ncbi:MAG TPA: hypothetical protein VFW48_07650 [Solirubrobacterales bacterium]|nr:hypothetical protein [Solirubrobacterales bacterium]
MQLSREAILERERRWAMPVALATFAALAMLIASTIVVSSVSGDGEAEILRAADAHRSDIVFSSILQAVGLALLVLPLVFLFRAAQARSERVRPQLIGLVVAAPLFLAGGALCNAIATNEAAKDFVDGKASADLSVKEATRECVSDRGDDKDQFREDFGGGRAAVGECASEKVEDDAATNAVADAGVRGLATGLSLGGRLGLAFALAYSCLWAMRTGLLTRFWGSLGMALGIAALLLLIQFTLLWFLYFALLAAGWVPGGRPPAWAAGESIPWPTPGEKAAEELSQAEDEDDPPSSAADLGAPPEKGHSS